MSSAESFIRLWPKLMLAVACQSVASREYDQCLFSLLAYIGLLIYLGLNLRYLRFYMYSVGADFVAWPVDVTGL